MANILNWRLSLITLMGFVIASSLVSARGQSVATREEISKAIAIENVKVEDNIISGEVINRSPHVMRDVEVAVQYHWLWADEFNPGANPPGRTVYIKLDEVLPGTSESFVYAPKPPLRASKAGHFMHEVSVAGFTVVALPKQPSTRSSSR